MKRIKDSILNTTFSSKGIFTLFVIYVVLSSLIIFLDFSSVIKTPLVITSYILILGFLISKHFGLVYKENKLTFWLYSIGFSLVTLMLVGLIINYILPILSIKHPLGALPILVVFDLILISLSYNLFRKNIGKEIKFNEGNLEFMSLHTFIPVVFLVISSIGTTLLNSIGDNRIVLLLAPSICAYFIYLFVSKKNFNDSVYISTIFFSALSLILTFSMRGPNIIGWDINEEFQVFSKTLENLRWSMDFYKGLDYNACISITILPTIFQVLTGIGPHYIFKFFFQIFFALLPLSVFSISNKYINKKLSLLASFLFISQTWFFEQMPALIRQEVAFYIYSLLLIIILNDEISKKLKYSIVTFLSFGLVISHYTTSYIIVAIFGGLFVITFILDWLYKRKKEYFGLFVCFLIIVLVMFWQIVVTNTGDAFIKLVSLNERKGVDYKNVTDEYIEDNSTEQNGVEHISIDDIKTKLEGQPEKLKEFYIDIVTQYVVEQDERNYNNTEAAKYIPKAVDDVVYVKSIFPDYINNFFKLLNKLLKLLLYVVAPILGFIYFAYSTFKNKVYKDQNVVIVTALGLSLVIMMVAIPYLQIHYNLTRLFLQVFITLSAFTILILNAVSEKFKVKNTWVVIIIGFFFLFQTGFIDQFTGGYRRITLNTAPADHYLYLINTSETYSARWLKKVRKPNDLIQADNMANLRLQSFGDSNSNNSKVFPLSMKKDAFVYLIKVNVVDNMAFLQYQNQTIKYTYPTDFLNSNKNLIYSSQGSRIYR